MGDLTRTMLDLQHAEQRVAQFLEERYPELTVVRRYSETAFWMLTYGMSLRRVYCAELRDHADEEGCSNVFCAIFVE